MRRSSNSGESNAVARRGRRILLIAGALLSASVVPTSAGNAAPAQRSTVGADALHGGIAPFAALTQSGAGAVSDPRFTAPVVADTGKWPGEMVTADFNGDGNPDLATADSARSISVIPGEGDGSFGARVAVAVGGASQWQRDIATADVSGDGTPDLITTGEQRGEVTVLVNDGAGHFRDDRSYRARASEVQAADVNADGLVDVVVSRRSSRKDLAVLLGTGGGRLAPARSFAGHEGVADLAIGDLNRDGRLDVALAGYDAVLIRLGNGDGTFGPERRYAPDSDDEGDVGYLALADFNRDQVLDVVSIETEAGDATISLGVGDGSFTPSARYYMQVGAANVVVADFDGDGISDIATSNPEDAGPAIRRGRGDGTFGPQRGLPWLFTMGGAVADFNRDGRTDLAFSRLEGYHVKVFLNWTGLSAPPCVVLPVTPGPLRQAKRLVRFGDCRVGRVSRRYSSKVKRNEVMSQRPAYGSVLPNGSHVDLVVSRGRRR